jgi:hypothetical protein
LTYSIFQTLLLLFCRKVNNKRSPSNKVANLATPVKARQDVSKSKTTTSGTAITRQNIKVSSKAVVRKPPTVKHLKSDTLFDSDVESTNSANSKSSASELEVLKVVKKAHGKQYDKKINSKQDNSSIGSVVHSPSQHSTSTPVRATHGKNAGSDKPITTFYITTPNRNSSVGAAQTAKTTTPDLAAIGISPAKSLPFAAQSRTSSVKDCLMKAVIIRGLNNSAAIVMRCAPIVTIPNSFNICWSEKVFVDALRNNETWTTEHSICHETQQWFHENIQMKNGKGYAIRLFVMYADNVPTHHSVAQYCESVCRCINSSHGNTTTISVNAQNMFWLPDNSVWSDVVGVQKSVELIVSEKGNPERGFYEENEELILTHFHDATLSVDLANYLHAPDSALHSSVVAQRKCRVEYIPSMEEERLRDEESDVFSASDDLLA